MLGLGTRIHVRCFRHWASLEIGVKSTYWTNFWEWKGEIIGKMKRVVVSAEFDVIDSSFMSSIKICYRFGYRRIPSHVKKT
jgi:hypothetical protein